jgi:hypothetical protein
MKDVSGSIVRRENSKEDAKGWSKKSLLISIIFSLS